MGRGAVLAVTFALLSAAQLSGAAEQQQPQGPSELRVTGRPRPSASAVPAIEPPTIDGLLDDRAWQDAPPFVGTVQAEPAEGEPSTEITEVRFLFDDEAIYVGAVMRDRSPAQIVETESRRDGNLNDQDSIQVVFGITAARARPVRPAYPSSRRRRRCTACR